MRYPVNEVFVTLQGEATFTGTPATFVRLQGCPVGCGWCDTKHTWEQREDDWVEAAEMLAKQGDSHVWSWLDVEQVVQLCAPVHHVVLTGGEPCLHNLQPLTAGLVCAGHRVQVETSGTHAVQVHPSTWVTVSPKVAMPGGYAVLAAAMERADEIKMPVGKATDVDHLLQLLQGLNGRARPVYLQPLSQSTKATELCVAAATAHRWRVSVQVHKYLGLR